MRDEARELLGVPPCKYGGNVYKINVSDLFISEEDDPTEITSMLSAEPDGIDFLYDKPNENETSTVPLSETMSDAHAHEGKAKPGAIAKMLEAAQKAQRAKFEIATLKYFRAQEKRLTKALNGEEKADWSVWDVLQPYITADHVADAAAWAALGEDGQKSLVSQFIGSLIDWPGEKQAMEEIFRPTPPAQSSPLMRMQFAALTGRSSFLRPRFKAASVSRTSPRRRRTISAALLHRALKAETAANRWSRRSCRSTRYSPRAARS